MQPPIYVSTTLFNLSVCVYYGPRLLSLFMLLLYYSAIDLARPWRDLYQAHWTTGWVDWSWNL